jgi:hypothetical protein
MNPFYVKGTAGMDEIPMEMVSIYLGMPIGFNRYENSKLGKEVLASMLEDAHQIGRSKLRITHKMHALKIFVFPRIDYRMMCADLARTHLEKWDWKRFEEWSRIGSEFMGFQSSSFKCHGVMAVSHCVLFKIAVTHS